jgi:uncharacterized membrane protein YagU involved in acid resistance
MNNLKNIGNNIVRICREWDWPVVLYLFITVLVPWTIIILHLLFNIILPALIYIMFG